MKQTIATGRAVSARSPLPGHPKKRRGGGFEQVRTGRSADRRDVVSRLSGDVALAEDAPPAFKRTPLQAIEFPDGYKTVTGLAEIAPGGASGAHTHPGIETGYVLEGEALMIVEGQPDRTLKSGIPT